jgi:hypothetical protein
MEGNNMMTIGFLAFGVSAVWDGSYVMGSVLIVVGVFKALVSDFSALRGR